jgi:hypothetical protein
MFHDLHAVARMLIQHPLRDNKLIAAWKNNLNLMQAKCSTPPNNRDFITASRMVRVVDLRRAGNMSSVCVLRKN